MIVRFEASGNFNKFSEELKWFNTSDEVKGIIILSCAGNEYTQELADPLLLSLNKPVTGGIFPGILFGNHKYESGTIFIGIDQQPTIYAIQHLSKNNNPVYKTLQHHSKTTAPKGTLLVFIDGFSTRITELIENLFLINGIECNYIGGGAGSLDNPGTPCIFTNNGLISDAASIAVFDTTIGIGVRHGWQTIAGPYMVTSSDKNIIKTLNNQAAFDVYKNKLEHLTGQKIDKSNFSEVAKAYPFGMPKLETERIIRDPVSFNENGEIICVGEVPKGTFIDIMHGDKNSLVQAAREAQQLSISGRSEGSRKFTFLIDCISRVNFLGESFNEELNAVHEPDVQLLGALTIGEIANTGTDFIEFYNKTAVVGSF